MTWTGGRRARSSGCKLARADELEKRYQDLLPEVKSHPPSRLPRHLGGGWEVDISSGNLQFKCDGEMRFEMPRGFCLSERLVKEGDPITLRSGKVGCEDKRLQLSEDFVVHVWADNGYHRLDRLPHSQTATAGTGRPWLLRSCSYIVASGKDVHR